MRHSNSTNKEVLDTKHKKQNKMKMMHSGIKMSHHQPSSNLISMTILVLKTRTNYGLPTAIIKVNLEHNKAQNCQQHCQIEQFKIKTE